LNAKDLNIMGKFLIDQFKAKNDTTLIIMAENYLVRKQFLQELNSKFQVKMEEKAEEDLKKPSVVLAYRSERAIIAGTQNMASNQNNSKQTKSKSKKVISNDQNENLIEISFIEKTSLIKELKSIINDLDNELVEPLIEYFLR
jgi:hypothetical protein